VSAINARIAINARMPTSNEVTSEPAQPQANPDHRPAAQVSCR
jgi:hypothetical protein